MKKESEKTRLEAEKIKKMIEHFVARVTAQTSAKICRVNRKTAVTSYHRFRELIAEALEKEHKIFALKNYPQSPIVELYTRALMLLPEH